MTDKIYLEHPAREWEEALPIGNGKFGGMVFGKTDTEKISLNIDELWSGFGKIKKRNNSDKTLQIVRKLIKNEKNYEAETILQKDFLNDWTEAYLPLGNLNIRYGFEGEISDYRRILDMEEAVVNCEFKKGTTVIETKTYISHPDKIMVHKISSSKRMDIEVWLDSPLKYKIKFDDKKLLLYGNAPSSVQPNYYKCDNPVIYDENNPGMGYCVGLVDKNASNAIIINNKICYKNTNDIVLYVYAETAYSIEKASIERSVNDVISSTELYLDAIKNKKEEVIREEHEKDYSNLFNRCSLSLKSNKLEYPTDYYLRNFQKCKDNSLIELFFNYGKYLLISSSREKTMPANLQGIWNDKIRAPWSSNYTTNINLQMNYWAVEKLNLSELHLPLMDMLMRCVTTGSIIAKNQFGSSGWVLNHNVDGWLHASPVGKLGQKRTSKFGYFPTASGWLCLHIWEHYLYTQDKEFLKKYYGVLKGACDFYEDYISEKEETIEINPSTSPENMYYDEEGRACALSINSTIDCSIIRCLFKEMAAVTKILNLDEEYAKRLDALANKIPKYRISKDGTIAEWIEDYPEVFPEHRHISHLFGIFPGRDIKVTKEVSDACIKTLKKRTMEGTAWCKIWKACIYARIKESELSYEQLCKLIQLYEGTDINYETSGCYLNLFTATPLQIDGNLGFPAAVIEMLIRDDLEEIELLPALPLKWKDGEIKGVKIIGGHIISFKWENSKIIDAVIDIHGRFEKDIIVNENRKKYVCENCQKLNIMIEK